MGVATKKVITHEQFMEKVENKHPSREWKIITRYEHNKKPILVKDKYGICSMTPNSLLNRSNPSIKTAVDKTAYTKAKLEEIGMTELYDFTKFQYLGVKTKSTVICKRCKGEFQQHTNALLEKYGCKDCGHKSTAEFMRKDKEHFVKRSIETHGNLYGYEEVIYTGAQDKVKIRCKHHGIFEQTPNSHNNGAGCPVCGSILYNTSMQGAKSVKEAKDISSGVYLMHFTKSGFYKVGISNSPSRRARAIANQVGEMPNILEFKEMSLYESYKQENNIHKKFEVYKYRPKVKFHGHTECFNSELPVEEVIEYIKTNKHGTKQNRQLH